MSCKLLRQTLELPTVSLFGTQPPKSAAAAPEPWNPANDNARQQCGDETARLHQRIQQLESSAADNADKVRAISFQEGEAAGREKATAEVRPVITRLSSAIADIAGLRARVRADAERDLVTLSLAIARRILRREIAVDPDAVQGLVRAALDKLQSRDITRVRVYPGHEDTVRRCLGAAHAGSVEVLPDPAMQAGDIVVETLRGNLDASVETQLKEIDRGLADRLR